MSNTRRIVHFRGIATSGSCEYEHGSAIPLALDLRGCETHGDIPLLFSHAPFAVLGRVALLTPEDDGRRLVARGWLWRDAWTTESLLAAMASGFKFGLSVGVARDGFEVEHIDAGERVWFNRRSFATPLAVARKFRIPEISATLSPRETGTTFQVGRFVASDDVSDISTQVHTNMFERGRSAWGRPSETTAIAPMPPLFRDPRGRVWSIHFGGQNAASGDAVAGMLDRIADLVARIGGFAELIREPGTLAQVLPAMCYSGDGKSASSDAVFQTWLAHPAGDWFERVVPALAEACVAEFKYDAMIIDGVSRAVYAALGELAFNPKI